MEPDLRKMKLLEELYRRDDQHDDVEALVQHHIRQRALRCSFCQVDLDIETAVIGFSKFEAYDDRRRRREYYNFCSEAHKEAYKSWDRTLP